jgi:hypothetical protein
MMGWGDSTLKSLTKKWPGEKRKKHFTLDFFDGVDL